VRDLYCNLSHIRITVYLLNYKKALSSLCRAHPGYQSVTFPSAAVKTLKLVSCGYLAGNTINTHGLETITLIRIQNLANALCACIMDNNNNHNVTPLPCSSSQRALLLLNVKWEDI